MTAPFDTLGAAERLKDAGTRLVDTGSAHHVTGPSRTRKEARRRIFRPNDTRKDGQV